MRLVIAAIAVLLLLVVVPACRSPERQVVVADDAGGGPASAALPDWARASNVRKPWTRWWWPGSAVDKASLTRQLEELARVGIGGVEITPIYGANGYESRYLDFLSPEYMAMLEHVGREARRLGLGVDMATGTGWPFGGPWINERQAIERMVLRDGRLIGEPTGMKVKRAAPGGEGLVVNPFSTRALRDYLAPFSTAFAGFPPGLIRGQFHDSFEYYEASWTPDLPEVFRSMHGYDIQQYAAILMGKDPADAATRGRVKSDFRATLNRMHQQYLAEWKRWSNERGFLVRNQSHGAPANLLDLYGMVDIAETETFGSTPFPIPGLRRDPDAVRHDQSLPEPLVTRMASSASHVMGNPLTSAEAATWLRDHWKVTPGYVKPEIDRIFLDGINHVIYHGTVFSPQDAPWPGWLFYAATQFNPANPWWEDFAALNAYVERVQTVLQAGSPDNRVLLYWPIHDLWSSPDGLMQQLTVHDVGFIMASSTGALARKLAAAGYAFDYISDEQIARTRVSRGELLTPGNRYDVLVIPRANLMPLETLGKLLELARGGARIVFEDVPGDVPGLASLEERRRAFGTMLEDLKAREHGGAAGRDVLAALREAGTPREGFADTPIGFIRRRTPDGHSYFIANLAARAFSGWVTLGVAAAGGATITDPLTGRSGAAVLETSPGSARIYLQLEPGQSMLLSTRAKRGASGGRSWSWFEPAAATMPLDGSWRIEFIKGGPVLPPPVTVSRLDSWTILGGGEAMRFAGTARYRIEFDAPDVKADEWMLELGDLRDSARVRLNGIAVATVWSLPFRILIGSAMRPGRNTLELEVTNTAANRIRDLDRRGVPWKIMREINFVNIRYQPFNAADWPVEPAGLLGPVRLGPMRRLSDVRYAMRDFK